MIDQGFWKQIASSWISVYSKEDSIKVINLIKNIAKKNTDSRVEEASVIDELKAAIYDEDDDDDY